MPCQHTEDIDAATPVCYYGGMKGGSMTKATMHPEIVRTSVHVDKADLKRLDEIAVDVNPTIPNRAEMIRQAIREFIARYDEVPS